MSSQTLGNAVRLPELDRIESIAVADTHPLIASATLAEILDRCTTTGYQQTAASVTTVIHVADFAVPAPHRIREPPATFAASEGLGTLEPSCSGGWCWWDKPWSRYASSQLHAAQTATALHPKSIPRPATTLLNYGQYQHSSDDSDGDATVKVSCSGSGDAGDWLR
ncbi:hypothetical protein [Nocardia sp. CNY236]|uniref:hypothetical protein n=1 Tax=Nocardia sp. CNY236 TaxID=1169152 RepID=UPI0012DC38E3|nr:hypothetical protein [Nocardia sp. CNY236]